MAVQEYNPEQLIGWHEGLGNDQITTTYFNFEDLPPIPYYTDSFTGADCNSLVSVWPSNNPEEGTPPIIKVHKNIPEQLQGYFALHEYIEFDIARLPGVENPETGEAWTCAEIEELVLDLIPSDLRLSYVQRRIDMFNFIDQNISGLTGEMSETRRFLSTVLEEETPPSTKCAGMSDEEFDMLSPQEQELRLMYVQRAATL